MSCDLAISLLSISLEKNITGKDTCTPVFIAALFTTVKTWKKPKCPLIRELGKEYAVPIYNGILLSH